jgi:hypothetical protein
MSGRAVWLQESKTVKFRTVLVPSIFTHLEVNRFNRHWNEGEDKIYLHDYELDLVYFLEMMCCHAQKIKCITYLYKLKCFAITEVPYHSQL